MYPNPKHNKPSLSSSSSSSSSKISDIVRLQRILKKWKNLANSNAPKNSASTTTTTTTTTASHTTATANTGAGTSSRGIKFLKRTLSFTDVPSASSSGSSDVVPKGFLAVCVGKELKRFIIPTEYLRHQAFGVLLQEAEEEFGFQQEGVLKIPCQVSVFEKILKAVEEKKDVLFLPDHHHNQKDGGIGIGTGTGWCSPDPHHPQLCR